MTDFAIYIGPSEYLNKLIQANGRSNKDISINNTLYTHLYDDIGVNIETKRTGEDLRDAQYKLQTSASYADCFCLLAAVTCCLHPFEKVVERRLLRSCVKNKF